MYNEQDVIRRVNNYYVDRLRRWTGLEFHVETRDDTKEQTFHDVTVRTGKVSVSVCGDFSCLQDEWITMSARTWDELYDVVDASISTYFVLSFAKQYGAQAFTGIEE